MSTSYQRIFRGGIEAVIFDWAGTTYDFGSMAPIRAFQALFEANQVPIALSEAREPMGTEKREHITRILAMPRVKNAWSETYGAAPTEADIDRLYDEFLPLQLDAIKDCAQAIPGLMDSIQWLKARDILVGANTGYNEVMLQTLAELAAKQGYEPDSSVSAADVPKGRPFPHMSLKNALELGVSDVRACVKVDDTLPGIEEGLAAGMWTIGVAISGNEVGCSLQEWQDKSATEQNALRQQANERFLRGGSHVIIDSVAQLPLAVEHIEGLLAQGLGPDSPGITGKVLNAATQEIAPA